ncbi:MAG: cold shock domain-containing protein CspD [Pseudomonadota bacterium]
MATGRVKWFNNAKGYGFILPDHGDGDLFAHYTSIEMEGYKTLKAGQAVNFEVIKGDKGLHAIKIVPEPEEDALETTTGLSASSTEATTQNKLEAV